jgi:hypothetical protein
MPVEEETRQRNGKFVTAMRPLFPGYIFVAQNVAHGSWRSVNSTYGVTRLVSFGKEPAAVPLDLVSQLMLRCDAEGKLLPPKLLKPGDQVTLTKGPLQISWQRWRRSRPTGGSGYSWRSCAGRPALPPLRTSCGRHSSTTTGHRDKRLLVTQLDSISGLPGRGGACCCDQAQDPLQGVSYQLT